MRGWGVLPLLALALASQGARASGPAYSFIELATQTPGVAVAKTYQFELMTDRDDFSSAIVYFNLANGLRFGCGVFAGAICKLTAAGQTLTLNGVRNGIVGSFAWTADSRSDNRPTELSFALPRPQDANDYVARIVTPVVAPVPEPAVWALLIVGFAAAGAASRARRWCPA